VVEGVADSWGTTLAVGGGASCAVDLFGDERMEVVVVKRIVDRSGGAIGLRDFDFLVAEGGGKNRLGCGKCFGPVPEGGAQLLGGSLVFGFGSCIFELVCNIYGDLLQFLLRSVD